MTYAIHNSLYNFVIAFEAFHPMHNGKINNTNHFSLKLDPSKAFDKMEYNYLEAVLIAMCMPLNLVERIMNCLRTVRYSVLINGSLFVRFIPTRGIHQGDPLSLYLFIICTEGLSVMIPYAERQHFFFF